MNTQSKQNKWTIVVGVWEMLAPLILGYSARAGGLWNGLICGALLIVFGIWALNASKEQTRKSLNQWAIVLGIWLILAPFIVGYASIAGAVWNEIIVGIVAIVLGWTGVHAANQQLARSPKSV